MTGVVRVAALFLGYGALGMGGDYVVGLLAHDALDEHVVVVDVAEVVEEVVQDVEVAVDVQVRSSANCAFMVEREVSVPAAVGQLLRLRHGSGELSVTGREGLDEVRATGTVCASHEEFLEDLTLTVEQLDGEIVLAAHYPESRNWRGNRTAKIDLVVEMPLNLDVDVQDSSGSLDVTGSGALHIDDSSGSILVREARGDVEIRDGSGGIEVFDVAGGLMVRDGSGGIDISDVAGAVEVRDGSGSVQIARVGSDVSVSDGSGSIRVRDVQGDFSVPRDGSGSIRHDGVSGSVDVPVDRRRRGN